MKKKEGLKTLAKVGVAAFCPEKKCGAIEVESGRGRVSESMAVLAG